MTKIYEALENAGNERDGGGTGTAVAARVGRPSVKPRLPKGLEEKLLSLYHRIEALLEGQQGKVIEFTGIQAGEDSSRLVREFAVLLAARLTRRVLLVSAYPAPYPGSLFSGLGSEGWEEVLAGRVSLDDVIHPVPDTRLSVSQMSGSDTSLLSVLGSAEMPQLMGRLRERFEVVLVDAPPLSASTDAAVLSEITDGVVLVVEAGKTRWQVIKNGMEQVMAQQGTVLGVILNRRRHYIPDFIYRRL